MYLFKICGDYTPVWITGSIYERRISNSVGKRPLIVDRLYRAIGNITTEIWESIAVPLGYNYCDLPPLHWLEGSKRRAKSRRSGILRLEHRQQYLIGAVGNQCRRRDRQHPGNQDAFGHIPVDRRHALGKTDPQNCRSDDVRGTNRHPD